MADEFLNEDELDQLDVSGVSTLDPLVAEWGEDILADWENRLTSEDRRIGRLSTALILVCKAREAKAAAMRSHILSAIYIKKVHQEAIVSPELKGLDIEGLRALYLEPFSQIEQSSSDIVNTRHGH